MGMTRLLSAGLIVGGLFWSSGGPVAAAGNDRTILSGCVTERTDSSVTLNTTGGEQVTVDTTWINASMRDALTAECVTMSTMMVDGKYTAESVDEGIDNEASSGRSDKSGDREDDGDKNSGDND